MIRIQDYIPTAEEEAANDGVLPPPLREQAREEKRRQGIKYAAKGFMFVRLPLPMLTTTPLSTEPKIRSFGSGTTTR